MPNIGESVKRKLAKVYHEAGFKMDDNVFLHNISMTDMPKDDFNTKVVHKRAMHEAKDIEENYYCYVCGLSFNHPDEFTLHYNEHLEDFLAGIPIKRTEEHIEKMVKNVHPIHQEEAKKIIRKGVM